MLQLDEARVLLADDTDSIRQTMRECLTAIGFHPDNIIEAEDGNAALDIIFDDPTPDLIVTDWAMPFRTGLDVIRETRKDFGLFPPCILATTKHFEDEIDRAKTELASLGNAIYFDKRGEISAEALLNKVRELTFAGDARLPKFEG